MFKVLRHSEENRIIKHEGYTLGLIAQRSDFEQISINNLDGIIINTERVTEIEAIILHVRIKEKLLNSLKPIFFINENEVPKGLKIHLDGKINLEQLEVCFERVKVISNRLKTIEDRAAENYFAVVKQRLLGFLYTRNTLLEPVLNRQSKIGYVFPFLSLFYKSNETLEMLKLLYQLKEEGNLTTKLIDNVHLCKSCHGNYFNFREVCPSCKSIDITPQDMIHHFVCAHVAPATDFKKGDGIECPKCDKPLRHIGIDYDKPSTIFHCNSCNNEFQEPNMEALCIDCGTSQGLEELVSQQISSFSLTKKGEHWLINPLETSTVNTETNLHNFSNSKSSIFKIVLKQEIARIKTHNCESVYAQISITNKYLNQLNAIAKQAFHNELIEIISSYLLESDIMSSNSYEAFHLLLPNSNFKNLERLENIDYNLQKLLADNIDFKPENLEIKIHYITHNDTVEQLLALDN